MHSFVGSNNLYFLSNCIRNKRKRFNEKLKAKKKQIAQEQSRKKIKLGRTIEDDEQLALHFLSNT